MLIPVLLAVTAGFSFLFSLRIYNRLVALRNRAGGAWSDIDVQLKRRHDLIQSLVETVRGYAKHERDTLDAIVAARSAATVALKDGAEAAAPAESEFAKGIGRLFAVVEAYPDLKADQNFRQLHRSLVEVEEGIQNARRYYNAVVRDLNTRIQSFPDLIVARLARFKERSFFELDAAAERAVPRFDLGAS
jgi:LemA protein